VTVSVQAAETNIKPMNSAMRNLGMDGIKC
jgi:hypothetical protein